MGFLDRFRTKWAIRSYMRRLPRLLVADYGRSKSYTPEQVRATIERNGLNRNYSAYAVAMFCGREGFERSRANFGEERGFDDVRAEIGFSGCAGQDGLWDIRDAFVWNEEFSHHDPGSGDFGGHH